MLRLDPLELVQHFRQPGGADFTAFVNEVICNTCREGRIPESEISTCSRTDARDGGVDTRVKQGSSTDETGYLLDPTVWQIKAADESGITDNDLRNEVNKPHAKACLEQGHAYRICVCDHLPDVKKTRWLHVLNEAIQAINPSAPQPKVLSVDDLARLANRYPALVMMFRPSLFLSCRRFDSLAASETALTPLFVPTPGFEVRKSAILKHVDPQQEVPDPVLSFQGEAGVGKTRTVYESLCSLPQARSLVLYSDDEEGAIEVARLLANDPTAHGILLADECTVSARQRLNNTLRGCKDRVRAICIDNSGERISSAAPEFTIRRLSISDVEKVLRANFETIPQDRLRAYAHLSQGFIRLAADMCKRDSEIAAVGSISPVMATFHDYYRKRLTTNQREAVEAIALLRRVGHKGESGAQLEALCCLTGLERSSVQAQLDSVKDAPGFVERGARYYRVTPEIIAMVAFEGAWKRWAERDPESFLQRITADIQESFLERVSQSASTEVRRIVQGFFRRFADNFTPGDLADIRMVNRFINLIETGPALYLAMLRKVVESAGQEQLTSSEKSTGGGWGPRRQLVWLAERFAQFPEFFADCEAILFKLSIHECEPSIGNNATEIWKQLFRLQLSGTALPLSERLMTLRHRLAGVDDRSAGPIAGALKSILDFMGTRILGPPVVGGRIPPAEWHPTTLKEQNEAISEALALLKDASRVLNPTISDAVKEAILTDVEFLVHRGSLDQVRQVFTHDDLPEVTRALLVAELRQRIARNAASEDVETRIPNAYLEKVQGWLRELQPASLHGNLVEKVGPNPWSHYGQEGEWTASLQSLACTLFQDEEAFHAELEWLLSSDAKAAFEFGHQFGAIDKDAKYLKAILRRTTSADQAAFPRGYASGLVYGAKSSIDLLNQELDGLEMETPVLAFQITHAGGNAVHIFERTVRLINEGKLPASYLRNFAVWVGDRKIKKEEVVTALRILLREATKGDSICSDVMIEFLGYQQNSDLIAEYLSTKEDSVLVWDVLEAFAEHPGREDYWWEHVIIAAARFDQKSAVRLACRAAMSNEFHLSDTAMKVVSQLATLSPEDVLNEFGGLMLNDPSGWKSFTRKFPIFTSLPTEMVIKWIENHGVEAARRVARHLPSPFLDAEGKPALNPLTEFVLSKFEDDDRTFREFCAGIHHLRIYTGSYASIREEEAKFAEKFFNHPLRRVREWARSEYESALRDAQRDREMEDEIDL